MTRLAIAHRAHAASCKLGKLALIAGASIGAALTAAHLLKRASTA